MFRRLTDRLTAAVHGGDEDKVRTLQSMGFDATQSRIALRTANGDVDRAAELLLSSPSTTTTQTMYHSHDEALRNAMEESLQTEEQRLYRQAQEASLQRQNHRPSRPPPPARPSHSAASQKAAQAAVNRSSSRSPLPHHPDVKVPTRLEDKSKEEQVLRNVDRVKSYPAAVDTLYKALVGLRNDPGNPKYRKIDKTTAGYKRSLATAPGAEALLITMNFVPHGPNTLIVDRSRVDPALLYLGISALEGAKHTKEYKEAKRLIQFNQELRAIQMEGNSSEAEALKRADNISKCPSEPTEGRGALIQIGFGEETIKRRFDSDDVLRDVLNWLGGHGSIIPQKLLGREWCLVDKNRYPINPIDCEANIDKTLQYIGFWPSGLLEIRPSPLSWLDGSDDELIEPPGSARGLGAAPREAL